MIIDTQVIVDLVVDMLSVAFPIALIFSISAKLTNFFTSFVFGKEVRL